MVSSVVRTPSANLSPARRRTARPPTRSAGAPRHSIGVQAQSGRVQRRPAQSRLRGLAPSNHTHDVEWTWGSYGGGGWHVPPHSPDLNPIEKYWGWHRKKLRAMDLADAVAKRPVLNKTAYKARVRRVIKSVRSQTVAGNSAKGLRGTCKDTG